MARNLPDDIDPGLEASAVFAPDNFNFPFGTHVCVLEIDSVSGDIDIRRYVAIDDCGNRLNPTIVEGQVHGGIAQGIGQALFEEAVYDENGSLVTGSLQDYAVPKAIDVPDIETEHMVTPTPHNPLGAKGVGESGAIAAPPAVVNAIVDAIRQIDDAESVRHIDMPVTAEKVWRAINS
jgi:carbon-monoxide dehydrogenase large subunit